jgi:hypothetical protein
MKMKMKMKVREIKAETGGANKNFSLRFFMCFASQPSSNSRITGVCGIASWAR